ARRRPHTAPARSSAPPRRCIALSRRLLNPAWGISGAADIDPHISIRERLERGALSLASKAVAARWGSGQSCVVCERLIAPSEIANGSVGTDAARLWTHLTCLRIWRGGTAAFQLQQNARQRHVPGELEVLRRRRCARRRPRD